MPPEMSSENIPKILMGAVCMAVLFLLVAVAYKEGTSWGFWIVPGMICGGLFGVISGAGVSVPRSVVNAIVCALGAVLWLIPFSAHGESGHYGYLLFSLAGLGYLPLTGVWFSLISGFGNLKISSERSFLGTSLELTGWKNRIVAGLLSGLISVLVSMLLASSKIFFWGGEVALFLEGMLLGGLLVWRNISKH